MIHDRDSGIVSRRQAVMLGGAAVGALVLTRGAQAQEATPQATPSECAPTTPEENKAIVQQFYAAWVNHDETALAGLLNLLAVLDVAVRDGSRRRDDAEPAAGALPSRGGGLT